MRQRDETEGEEDEGAREGEASLAETTSLVGGVAGAMDLRDCVGSLGYGTTRWSVQDLCTAQGCPFHTECQETTLAGVMQERSFQAIRVQALLNGATEDVALNAALSVVGTRVIAHNAARGLEERERAGVE